MRIYIVRGDIIRGRTKRTRALQAYGNRADTFKAIRRFSSIGEIENVSYQEEDVPINKLGLLDWINKFTEGTPEEVANE
jgi:hypothetical protein